MQFSVFILLAFALSTSAVPLQMIRRTVDSATALQNGQTALSQNSQFAGLSAGSPCTEGQNACINNGFAQCVNGNFVVQPCGAGLICAALPLVNSAGTSITCTTAADRDARIANTGAQKRDNNNNGKGNGNKGGNNAANNGTANAGAAANNGTAAAAADNGDPQKSLTLDPKVIAPGFANDGQAQAEAGQVPSLTSTNNFINFCLTTNVPLTNGQQIKTGSCNPAPMGIIAATTNMPSCKFQSPKNGDTIEPNQSFTVSLAIKHLETGHFTNANQNYFAAPQQVNGGGDIQGHSHIVIEKLSALDQTDPTDPTQFAFFKGLNAAGSTLTADVTNGLAEGFYRMMSINTAANHQPVLVAVAQHGSVDDGIYFTVKKGGAAAAAAPAAGGNATASASASASAASGSATGAAKKN